MKTVIWMLAIVAVLVGSPATARVSPDVDDQPTAAASSQAEGDYRLIQEAQELYQAGSPVGALAKLEAFMATPTFHALASAQRASILLSYYSTRIQLGQDKEIYPDLKKITDSGEDLTGDFWMARLMAESKLDRSAALNTMVVLLRRWPSQMSRLQDGYVFQMISEARSDKSLRQARADMLLAIFETGWKPSNPFTDLDNLRSDLVIELIERGDMAKAKAMAAQIANPGTIVQMRASKRFDAVLQSAGDRTDLSQIVESYTHSLRVLAESAPDRLAGAKALADFLFKRGQLDEALAVTDVAIAKATPASGAQSPFIDMDELRWVYDRRAEILLFLGRGDEALAAMKAGAGRLEHGADNVSQQLNLAEFYVALGRPKEAVAATDAAGTQLSAYGRMDREGCRAEAFVQLHDEVQLRQSLDYMKAHSEDAPMWLLEVLLETGDFDGAASYVIGLLRDPFEQASILNRLQDYAEPNTTPQIVKLRHQRIRTLRDRADVKAAIAAVGRVQTVPMLMSGL